MVLMITMIMINLIQIIYLISVLTKTLNWTRKAIFCLRQRRQTDKDSDIRTFTEPSETETEHDDVIKWKHFPRYWPFVRGIHRSPMNSPHKGQWHGALMLSLICFWINDWVNNREAGDLWRYRAHYDVTVMKHAWCRACVRWHKDIFAITLLPTASTKVSI